MLQATASSTSVHFTLCILLITLSTLSEARQVRISRYNVQVEEDSTDTTLFVDEEPEINATVREVTPYPAAGYRPGRAFKLPNERALTETTEIIATTTEIATETGTTEINDEELETTTTSYAPESTKIKFSGYPARGYRPRVAFNLPGQEVKVSACNDSNNDNNNRNLNKTTTSKDLDTRAVSETAVENKTPYPAAGYRPCAPFTLPTEEKQQQQQDEQQMMQTNTNPACGVSLNPLAPRPPTGTLDEPDSERVPVATNTGNGNGNGNVASAIPTIVNTAALRGPQPIIWQQPLTVVPQQPFVYTAHLQTW